MHVKTKNDTFSLYIRAILHLKFSNMSYVGNFRMDTLCFLVGMSFGVRFKVRTFGNKHPDGSNVRIFFFG